ncbi:MAG: hypothetical protein RL497_1368 [Pseudomonadota bacterium]|jgi:hypothetical protein
MESYAYLSVLALETWQSRATVVVSTCVLVVMCVLVHYEALNALTAWLKRVHLKPRTRILMLIFAILFTHVIEVWMFGLTYFALISGSGHGALIAEYPVGMLDCIYFSVVCFTTLGLGDIVPVGAIRFLVGTEALTGFVLVTWSASFTFVEMQRFWRD